MRQLNVLTGSPALARFTLAFAWTGGLVFVISLLWFVYCYLVRFDRPIVDTPSPARAVTIDVLLFTAFALHHSILARWRVKQYVHRLVAPELERSVYTWTSSLLFIAVCTLWQPVPGTLYRLDGAWRLIGYGIQLLGFVMAVKAAGKLDVLDLAGVRPLLRRRSDASEHVPLETTGLYGFVRHPLYFGWMCLVFGTPDMTSTRAVFAVVSTAYLALAIPFEERDLIHTFGADYEAYRRTVRWRMIPGVY